MNRFPFVEDHKDAWGVKPLCEVVEVARSSFYAWLTAAPGRATRAAADAALAGRIRKAQDRDLTHHACHLQAYMDPRMRDLLERELADLETIPLASDWSLRSHENLIRPVPGSTDDANLHALAQRIEDRGHAVYAVDLTIADIRPTGINVSRLIAVGLYSYAAAAFPCLGGPRLAALLTDPDTGARRLPLPH